MTWLPDVVAVAGAVAADLGAAARDRAAGCRGLVVECPGPVVECPGPAVECRALAAEFRARVAGCRGREDLRGVAWHGPARQMSIDLRWGMWVAVPITFLGPVCRVAAEHGLTCRAVARGLRWVGLAVVEGICPVAGIISLVPRCLVVGSGRTFNRRMQACQFRGLVAVTVLRWGMSRGLVPVVVEHNGLAVAVIDPAVVEELVLTGRVLAAGCRSARVRAALEGAEIDPAAETGRAAAKGRIGRAEES